MNLAHRTFSLAPTTDEYLTLQNEEYVRTMTIGNTWNSIRVGIMYAVGVDGTNNLPAVSLVVGVCSGKTAPYGAASTTNFIGAAASVFNAITGTFSYAANSGNPCFTCGFCGVKRVAITTTVDNGVLDGVVQSNASPQRRGMLYVNITKSSPNYSVKLYSFNAGSGMAVDYSNNTFISGLQTPGTPSGMSVMVNSSIPTSEVAGNFDTVDIFWNNLITQVEIYDIEVFRFS